MSILTKILLVTNLFLVGFSSCTKSDIVQCDGICINFINKTDDAISNFVVKGISISDLPHNGESGYIEFPEFQLINGRPLVRITGMYRGKIVTDFLDLMWCGTGLTYTDLEPGQYDMEVYLNKYIFLQFK